MANLLIGWPDIPYKATLTASNTMTNLDDCVCGAKSAIAEVTTEVNGTTDILYDLGSTTRACDFLAIAHAKILQKSGVDSVVLRGGSVSYALPSSISGLTLWLDATRGVTVDSSNRISSWASRVGSIVFTESNNSNKPIWNAPSSGINDNRSISFNGTSQRLTSTSILANIFANNAKTVFIVFRSTPNGIAQGMLATSNGMWESRVSTGSVASNNNDGTLDQAVRTNTITAGTTYVYQGRHEGGNIYANIDSATEVAVASGNTSNMTGTLQIGTSSGGNWLNGSICEILTYNVALNSTDRTNILNYLNQKWKTSAIYANNSFSTATLVGPNQEDFFTKFTQSSAFRYWALSFDSLSASKRRFSKAHFGQIYDLGRDPRFGRSVSRSSHLDKSPRLALNLNVDIPFVTNSTRADFYQKIEEYKNEIPVWFFTDTYDPTLLSYKALYAKIQSINWQALPRSLNNLNMNIKEVY